MRFQTTLEGVTIVGYLVDSYLGWAATATGQVAESLRWRLTESWWIENAGPENDGPNRSCGKRKTGNK